MSAQNHPKQRGRPPGDPGARDRGAEALTRLHEAVATWWPTAPKTKTPEAEAPGAKQIQLTYAVTSGADPTERPYAESTSR